MKSTFYIQRQYILESEDSVFNKLEKHPALKIPPLVHVSFKCFNMHNCIVAT